MQDFSETEPEKMNFKQLADVVSYYKEDKEGIKAMCKAMEDMITDEKKEIAIRMLEKGKMTIEDIAECSDLPIEVVQELAEEI